MDHPTLFLLAGPNGAGKTTYAFRHLRAVAGSNRFVNLDEIARGLSPLEPTAGAGRAARVALELVHDLIAAAVPFSIETTLAGRTHLRTIEAAHRIGYAVVLLYFAVPSPEICLERIVRRVAEGGHSVPEADVRRRFARSLANLPLYARACDLWRIFDTTPLRVVAEGRRECVTHNDGGGLLPVPMRDWLAGLPACPP